MEAVDQGCLPFGRGAMQYTTGLEHSMAAPHLNPLRLWPPRTLRRLSIAALASAAGLWLGVALLEAQVSDPPKENTRRSTQAATTDKSTRSGGDRRMREGTEILDQLGYFRMAGDRVTFFTDDGKGRFVALENLNLERIARAISDNPEQLQWGVTGTITEYRGANFIFVRRAALRSRVLSPEDVF